MQQQTKSYLFEEHQMYKENAPIEDIKYTINKDTIEVVSEESSTRFANLKRKRYITKEAILDLIKEIRQLSRQQQVKIKGINRLSNDIDDIFEQYQKEHKTYDEKFDILAVIWLEHVDKLRIGYSYDVIYQEVILKRQFELNEYSYLSSILSKVESIYERLLSISEELNKGNTLKMAEIY